MAEFPIMPVGTSDFLADTIHLAHDEMGLYWRMCLQLWRMPERRFPNDDEWLSKRFNADATAVRSLVVEFFQCDGNWVTHKRIEREYERVSASSKKQSDRAKARYKKEKTTSRGTARKTSRGSASTSTSIPIPIEEEPYGSSNSVSKETDAGTSSRSNRPKAIDPAKRTFEQGRDLLSSYGVGNSTSQGGVIQKWRKALDNDDLALQAIMTTAASQERDDIAAYMAAAVREHKQRSDPNRADIEPERSNYYNFQTVGQA